MKKNVNYFQMINRVKKSLTDLDERIKCDKSYLRIKLRNANEDQKAFYEFFLAAGNLNSFLERYYALFSSATPEEEDYENMKYYVNNLKYFSSIDPVSGFKYEQ